MTADSVPIREWYECLHKAQPLVRAAGGVLDPALGVEQAADPSLVAAGVFESILARNGQLLRLDRHLARLDTSCRELYGVGLPTDLADSIREAVALAEPHPRANVRVAARPVTAGSLDVSVEIRPLGGRLTDCRLHHQLRPDLGWRHKWLDRTWLSRSEARVAPELPYFTSTGQPERLSETSRGNLFLLGTDGTWRTPPLDESVLPGVTRREVLDLFDELGHAVLIERCSPADVRTSAGAFWTSSLSGAVGVTAVDAHPLPDATRLLEQLNHALGHR